MSTDDYKMGQQGLRYDRTMNKEDYDRGKAAREDQAALAGYGTSDVSGAGIGLLFMAPILAIMYPLVTLSLSVINGGLWLATEWMPPSLNWLRIVLSIAGIIAAFYFAFKAERRASESKIYRNFRHVFRVIVIGLATFVIMIDVRHSLSVEAALAHAPPASLFASLVAMGLMLWLGPGFDRFFFPVRDARAIRMEKKFAGKSTIEIDEIKHAETRSSLKFAAVWLAGTIALMFAMPHVSVALTAIGWFVVCWVGRRLFFPAKSV
ncbi:MAG TPA: hypothetical protein VJN95_02160 [Gemmatimonadales bacterium]|nr:hypothetical protein [Gemmatimonadales bacterium]